MVLVRAAAVKASRVAVDPRAVHPPLPRGAAFAHLLRRLRGKRPERSVQTALELLFVREEPGAFVIEAEFPEIAKKYFDLRFEELNPYKLVKR